MNLRRTGKAISSVALAAGLVLGAAACNNDDAGNDGNTSTTDGTDAKAAISTSFENLQNASYSMTMTVGDMVNGTFDVDASDGTMKQYGNMTLDMAAADETMSGQMDIEMIAIDQDIWIKMSGGDTGMPGMEDVWLHSTMDQADVTQFAEMDMAELTQQMLDSLDNLEEAGENTYTGTIDPSTVSGESNTKSEPVDITVVLDGDGMLKSFETTIPDEKGKNVPMKVEFTDYGKELAIEPPPADQVQEMGDMTL